jgi:serine/threonine protein kinase
MEKVNLSNLASDFASSPSAETPPPTLRVHRDIVRALKPATPETVGSYLLLKTIGRGSMGEVFLAQHLDDPNHLVALKVFRPHAAQAGSLQARFRNEITMSARVNHKNVIRPHEIIQSGDLLAYTMEYMDGGDLTEWMRQNPHPDFDEVLEILIQVCEGVQAIHNAGMIHRDLKPENILLGKDGSIRITDFALARTTSLARSTQRGKVVGTIDYLSPQYLEHGTVSPQCDVYSLGALAFELFARRAPIVADGVYDSIMLKISSDAPLLSTVNPSVPRGVAQVVAKALERSTELRFNSPREMAEALRAVLNDEEVCAVSNSCCDPSGETVLSDVVRHGPNTSRHLTLIQGGRPTQVEGHVVTFPLAKFSRNEKASSAVHQRRVECSRSFSERMSSVSPSTLALIALIGVTVALVCMGIKYL